MADPGRTLEILYMDDELVAVNKPNGLLVHRTSRAADANAFALQILRSQLGQRVYPLHRLDRKTSGVLLFCLEKSRTDDYSGLFRSASISKSYIAVVRGYTEDRFEVDYPLKREDGRVQEAFTAGRTLARYEIPVSLGKFDTSRYSFIELRPETGRMHQLRRHMAHILHPIIGDRPHGCNKQNRMWKERWSMESMLLHARSVRFTHPRSGEEVFIKAALAPCFETARAILAEEGDWPMH